MPAVFAPWETGTRAHSQLLLFSTFLAPWKPAAEPFAAYLGAGRVGFWAFLKSSAGPTCHPCTAEQFLFPAARNFSSGNAEIKFWHNFLLVFPPEEQKENKTKQQKLLSVGLSGLQSPFPDAARPMPWEEQPLSGTGILLELEGEVAESLCSVKALDPWLFHHSL